MIDPSRSGEAINTRLEQDSADRVVATNFEVPFQDIGFSITASQRYDAENTHIGSELQLNLEPTGAQFGEVVQLAIPDGVEVYDFDPSSERERFGVTKMYAKSVAIPGSGQGEHVDGITIGYRPPRTTVEVGRRDLSPAEINQIGQTVTELMQHAVSLDYLKTAITGISAVTRTALPPLLEGRGEVTVPALSTTLISKAEEMITNLGSIVDSMRSNRVEAWQNYRETAIRLDEMGVLLVTPKEGRQSYKGFPINLMAEEYRAGAELDMSEEPAHRGGYVGINRLLPLGPTMRGN